MDIDDGGMDGLMSQECLDGEQVRAILVKVGAKGMAEGMAGDAFWPAQAAFMCMDVPGKEKESMGSSLPDCFGKRYPWDGRRRTSTV